MSRNRVVASVFWATLCCCIASVATAQPVAHWSFDATEDARTTETVSGRGDQIQGYFDPVAGVKGKALMCDGYTTRIVVPAKPAPKLSGSFTIQAWVALGAYPWNWAPVVCQEATVTDEATGENRWWPQTLVPDAKQKGWYFGIGPRGELGLMLAADGKWQQCISGDFALPLRKWTHVAATFDPQGDVRLFVNGKPSGTLADAGQIDLALDEPLRIGLNREPRKASHPVRSFATLPSFFGFDGVIDELTIDGTAQGSKSIAESYEAGLPASLGDTPLPPRVLPSGPSGPGKFGACYARLKYHPGWDRLWRVAAHPDIVVQFDDSPVRVVFWRGFRFAPAWVMEDGFWMADQSVEDFNDQDGCIEHMLDPQCRFAHVRIIESSAARVVVHYRYCPVAANGRHTGDDPVTGMPDWVDEYYTFYPDGIGVRGVFHHTAGGRHGPQEFIAICNPGQVPEDVIEVDAMTVMNLAGKAVTYSWKKGSPKFLKSRDSTEFVDFGNDINHRPVVALVNYKSKYKPFEIFSRRSLLTVFGIEFREDASHFPWWNHFPVALIPSDGRYAQAADRPSHFSLAWGRPATNYVKEKELIWYAWLYGATDQPIDTLLPLARSWCDPPTAVPASDRVGASRFRPIDRSYEITLVPGGGAVGSEAGAVAVRFEASEKSPLVNPALVMGKWDEGDRVNVTIDGAPATPGKDFRAAVDRRLEGNRLVVWLRLDVSQPVTVAVGPVRSEN